MSVKTWDEVGLKPELKLALSEMRFNRPSKIQAAALPVILKKDGEKESFIGQAQSGSGKTAAFVLGFLQQITPDPYPQALVIAPTLELAEQIEKDVLSMGKHLQFLKVLLAIKDTKMPKKKCQEQVVVGTPGKLTDFTFKGNVLDLSRIKVFVLDEADHVFQSMADPVMKLRKVCPENAQCLFFSATFPETIARFAVGLVKEPYTSVRLKPEDVTVEEIFQYYVRCKEDRDKFQVLNTMYQVLTIGSTIVFMQRVQSAIWLAKEMEKAGHKVGLLYGKDLKGQEMRAEERLKVMKKFRDGELKVLITTNVLARGIDVLSVTMVVNYDLPLNKVGEADVESYIHRIGRTGRMGNKGIALSFVSDKKDQEVWNTICRDPTMKNAKVNELKGDDSLYETLEKLQQELQSQNKRK